MAKLTDETLKHLGCLESHLSDLLMNFLTHVLIIQSYSLNVWLFGFQSFSVLEKAEGFLIICDQTDVVF